MTVPAEKLKRVGPAHGSGPGNHPELLIHYQSVGNRGVPSTNRDGEDRERDRGISERRVASSGRAGVRKLTAKLRGKFAGKLLRKLIQKLLAKLISKLGSKLAKKLLAKLISKLAEKLGQKLGSKHISNLVQNLIRKLTRKLLRGRPPYALT